MFKKAITLAATMAFVMTSAVGAVANQGRHHHGHGLVPATVTLYAHVHILPQCTLSSSGSRDFKFATLEAITGNYSESASPVSLLYVCSTKTHPRLTLNDQFTGGSNNSPWNFFLSNSQSVPNNYNFIPFTITGDVSGVVSNFEFYNTKIPGHTNPGVLGLTPGTKGTIALTATLGSQNLGGGMPVNGYHVPPFDPGHYSDVVYATLYY